MLPIVEIGEAELAACIAPIRAAFAAAAVRLGLSAESCPSHPAYLTLERLRRARARGSRMFAARAAGEVVGCCELAPGEGGFRLERLAVVPGFRGLGLGGALLEHAGAAAAAAGGRTLEVGIVADDLALRRWYLARGFRACGDRRVPHLPFAVALLQADL